MKAWAVTYDLAGGRGRLFIRTNTRAGALSLLRAHFPGIVVLRIAEAT